MLWHISVERTGLVDEAAKVGCPRGAEPERGDSLTKLEEEVTVKREVTGVLRDLVLFVKYLREQGRIGLIPDDSTLISLAREFWDCEHGE